ncbi:unnamed protein product [Adineta ricciae]|uniref:Uncharacterized protein n=1 Tax=Adineta ricciae TaxID=249248 RepID=A0A815P7B3_ADIRI|nr:unnamed protein product [Adineta ricciae]CAF1602140.1 unnamed protein product [Adineta ricciae]
MATGATTGMADSYNSNSAPQLGTLVGSEHYIQCAINGLDLPPSSLVLIADFGASLGSNSLQAIKIIFQCLRETKKIDEHR